MIVKASLAREGTDADREAWYTEELRRELRRRVSEADAEAYEVAGGLPVRISTHDVQVGESRATFRISEHDGRGRLLRRFELTAVPAG